MYAVYVCMYIHIIYSILYVSYCILYEVTLTTSSVTTPSSKSSTCDRVGRLEANNNVATSHNLPALMALHFIIDFFLPSEIPKNIEDYV
jgi:hypothetical protein